MTDLFESALRALGSQRAELAKVVLDASVVLLRDCGWSREVAEMVDRWSKEADPSLVRYLILPDPPDPSGPGRALLAGLRVVAAAPYDGQRHPACKGQRAAGRQPDRGAASRVCSVLLQVDLFPSAGIKGGRPGAGIAVSAVA